MFRAEACPPIILRSMHYGMDEQPCAQAMMLNFFREHGCKNILQSVHLSLLACLSVVLLLFLPKRAQMALAELHRQAVQFLAVSLDLRRTWMTVGVGDTSGLTLAAKRMVCRPYAMYSTSQLLASSARIEL